MSQPKSSDAGVGGALMGKPIPDGGAGRSEAPAGAEGGPTTSRSRSTDRQRAARLAEIALSKCWHVPYGICGHCLEVAIFLTIITIRGETRARTPQ